MGAPSATGRTVPVLTALVLRRILAEPGVWSARSLALELGETPRRLQKIIVAVQQAGWEVEREEPGQRLTLRDGTPRVTRSVLESRGRLIQMYNEGRTRQEMADELGIEKGALKYRIQQLRAAGLIAKRDEPGARWAGFKHPRYVKPSPQWERAQGGEFPVLLGDLVKRLYGEDTEATRRRGAALLSLWVKQGRLIRTAPGVYDLPPTQDAQG